MPSPPPNLDGPIRLFQLTVAGASVSVDVHPIVALLLLGILLAVLLVWWRRSDRDRVVAITVDIPLGGIGRLTVNSDREVARLAQQAWLEIMTRKAGVPIDEDNDVIVEVLDSWYELFRQLRQIAKEVPPPSIRTKHARELVRTLVDALNRGMRPVLTKWQARYRAWLAAEEAKPSSSGKPPQDLQRRYPEYDAMMTDIKRVNGQLRQFADALYQLAQRAQAEAAASDGEGSTEEVAPT